MGEQLPGPDRTSKRFPGPDRTSERVCPRPAEPVGPAVIVLRRLAGADADVLRDVRLAALADSPQLFGSTLERERGFDHATWSKRASQFAVVERASQAVGLVGWVWTAEPRAADLVAMWVSPAARGVGAGRRLVRWVVDEVVSRRGAQLELGVVVDNHAAIALYEQEGFVGLGTELGVRSGDVLLRMRYTARRQ